MKLLSCLFLLAATLPAATIMNVACGGSTDTGSLGGARWTGAAIAGQPVPFNSMRSSSPLGAPFSYSFTLAPGKYTVTLQFIEPRADQTAGQRILGVAINGAAVITGLDLFTAAGALKPYTSAPLPVTTLGVLEIAVSATAGNAVISGIRIDSVDAPPTTDSRGQCESGVGDGSGPLYRWPYVIMACENMSGGPLRITRARCRSDVAGPVFDLMATDAAGVMSSLLVAPIICTPGGAEGPLLPGASYADGQVLGFSIRIVDTPPQNASQVFGSVEIGGSSAPVAYLEIRQKQTGNKPLGLDTVSAGCCGRRFRAAGSSPAVITWTNVK